MKTRLVTVLSLSLVTTAVVSSAQEPPLAALPEPAPELPRLPAQEETRSANTVTLELLSNTPGLAYEVYSITKKIGRDPADFFCETNCQIQVVPGEYRIRVRETEFTLAGSRVIRINSPTSILFDPDTRAKRTTGLVLGIAGPVAMLVGVGLVMGAAPDPHDAGPSKRNDALAIGGVGVLAAGAAMTAAGWVMFGTSFKPEYELSPVGTGKAPAFSAGMVPSSGGMVFAATLAF